MTLIIDPVVVINTIKPKNGNDFGVVEDIDFIGGYQTRATLAERDAINPIKLKVGMVCYVDQTQTLYRLTSTSPVTWASFFSTNIVEIVDVFLVANNGETSFTLSLSPVSPVELSVNGVRYREGTDFTVSGSMVTWTNAAFVLQIGDVIEVRSLVLMAAVVDVVDAFTATTNQTAFTLSALPISYITLTVNGIYYRQSVDFSIAGTLVTWLNTDFHFQNGDVVQMRYLS